MKHTIYTPENVATDLSFDTLEEAEEKIKECPEGYWIDTWFYEYHEELRQRYLDYFNCNE